MANLLDGASILSQRVISTGLGSSAAGSLAGAQSAIKRAQNNPGQIANIGINAGFSLISGASPQSVGASALQSVTGLGFSLGPQGGGGLQGTKPVALHTERAGSEAKGDIPYSFSTDIEFFLLRADQSAPSQTVIGEETPSPQVKANTQTGGNFLGDALASPLGQLATGIGVNAALSGVAKSSGKNSLVGPLTGLGVSAGLAAASGRGIFSQPAASAGGGTASAVSNAVGTGSDAVAAGQAAAAASSYWAPSEAYFTDLNSSSFDLDTSSISAFSGGAESALNSEMAYNFPGITSDASLTEALTTGELSYAGVTSNALAGLGIGSLTGGGAPALNEDATSIQSKDAAADIPKSWYFVTAPQDVSWSKEGRVSTADTYGTNSPYVLYGSTGLRKLTLGNVMLEGFSDRKTVEANIVALETCMNMVIQSGYTAPYCWKMYSGGKSYGTFIITGVKVKEVMRDLRGYATRAFVDIELQQVPDYQVNSGKDLAATGILGGVSSAVQGLINSQNNDKKNGSSAGTSSSSAAGAAAGTGTAGAQDAAVRPSALPGQGDLPNIRTGGSTAPSGQGFGAMASDVRLKENIARVGTSPSGLGIYEWNYKSGGPRYRGVMAQEVLSVFPSAVVPIGNGYLGVKYDLIDVDMELVS